MRIAVLCGGLSNEREVSLTSGTEIVNALRKKGHQAILLDSYLGYTGEYDDPVEVYERPWQEECYRVRESSPDLEAVKAQRSADCVGLVGPKVIELCRAADITFLALHGEEGENGKMQALLDMEGIRYTGSGYLGSAIAMNKYLTKQLLQNNGIATPEGIILSKADGCKNVGFPCVVKPCSGGSSVGTSIVREKKDYAAALEEAFRFEEKVLVEKYIRGRELTVGVLGGKAMPVIEIIPKLGFYDYKNKYQSGLTEELCPAPITQEQTERLQREAEKIFRVLMIDVYCRVDCLMDETGKLYHLEANTLPGMTPTSLIPQMAAAEGKDFGTLCEDIIAESLKKYE